MAKRRRGGDGAPLYTRHRGPCAATRQERSHHVEPMPARRHWLPLFALLLLVVAGCGTTSPSTTTVHAKQAGIANQPQSRAADPHARQAVTRMLTYVVIGASDAFGVGSSDPIHKNWPTLFAAQVGKSRGVPVHVVNLGIPGATSAQAVQDELPVAESVGPSIITVLVGTNDIVNRTPVATAEENIAILVFTLRATYPNAQILVGNLPDLGRLKYFAGRDPSGLQDELTTLNAYIDDLCLRSGTTLVDIYTTTAQGIKSGDVSSDGLHPTDAGAQAIAQAFLAALPSPPPATASPTPGTGNAAGVEASA